MAGTAQRKLSRGIRVALAALLGLGSLPYLVFGSYLLRCWIRIHVSDFYYVDYPYLAIGLGSLCIGLACLGIAVFSAKRRSFYGLLYLISVLSFLFAVEFITNEQPVTRSMLADSNYFGDISSYLRVWYESHHAFPDDESEFAQAMAEGPAEWQGRAIPTPESQYRRHGRDLPYEALVFADSTGPRVDNLSNRPGVVYYCVSPDLQEFWATMTVLTTDMALSATLKRIFYAPDQKVQIAQATGSDYPRDEKALQDYREKVKADPSYRHPLAETLYHLGVKYTKAQHQKEAEDAYKEALNEYRELAKTSPCCLPAIASTLNSLGSLYSDTSQVNESADAYAGALQIRRKLVNTNWNWYAPGLASTLNGIGGLDRHMQRFDESTSAYTEALQIRRALAKVNPTAYSPDLAETLSSLAVVDKFEKRNQEASSHCEEAVTIYRRLSVNNPRKYGPLLSAACKL